MKKLYPILLLMSTAVWAQAQCVIDVDDNNLKQADIVSCLTLAGCSANSSGCSVEIQANVDIQENINLTTYPDLTFTVSSTGPGEITFTKNGLLRLHAGSTFFVEEGGALNLATNADETEIYITIGSTNYTGSQFGDIIAAGGADANGLPIELFAFSGKADGSRILLHWTTASEQNNDYMAIEHSLDGRSFREIGRVEGAGNSQSLRHYELAHQHPFNGDNYYRIRQVDFDGAVAYHSVIAIDFVGKHRKASIYPNPADDILNLRIANEEAANVQLQVYDRTGKLVREQSLQSGQQAISTTGLQTGFYYIRITSGSITEVIPFEKL